MRIENARDLVSLAFFDYSYNDYDCEEDPGEQGYNSAHGEEGNSSYRISHIEGSGD